MTLQYINLEREHNNLFGIANPYAFC